MADDRSKHPEKSRRPVAEQVDAVASAFDAAWWEGQQPRIEDFLPGVDISQRAPFLVELLLIEVEHRRKRGETPEASEYLDRFPESHPIIEEAFERATREETANLEQDTAVEVSRSAPQDESTKVYVAADTGGDRASKTPLQDRKRRFGDYELLEELGKGGMGVVYKARQITADRIVALKLIRPDQLSQYHADDREHVLTRFRNEVRAAAKLEHDHVVTVYDVGEIDGQSYYAMRYVEGESLKDRLGEGPLEPLDAARYTQEVANALTAAHSIGILHRDLKPHNVMIDAKSDRALLADFGLAKLTDGDQQLTATDAVMGSPPYMSPEQTLDSGKVTAASDVYGLGATLYHLLTGRPPFQAANAINTMMQVQSKEPVAPRELNSSVPKDLETICLKCLEKEPDKRYESAKQLVEELGRFQKGEPIHARSISRPEKVWRWCRRNRLVAGLVAASLLILLVGIVTTSFFAVSAGNYAAGLEFANEKISKQSEDLQSANVGLQAAVDRANNQTEVATNALDDVKFQLKRAEDARHSLLWNGAQTASLQNDLVEAERLLSQVSPQYQSDWVTLYLKTTCARKAKRLLGHKGWATSVAYSPDGQMLASASRDNTIKLWDAHNGQELRTIQGHTDFVTCVAYSPDGRTLASASADKTIKLWDAKSGEERGTLRGHKGELNSLAFSPDGRTIASGGQYSIRVWGVASGEEEFMLRTAHVTSVAFSHDSGTIVSAHYDKTIKLWDAVSGKEKLTLEGHTKVVLDAAFSPDGRTIASSSADRTVRLWDAASGQEEFTIQGHKGAVMSVAFSPDGRTIASSSSGGFKLWDSRSGQEVLAAEGHTRNVLDVSYSPDGRVIASAGADQTIRLWNLESRQEKLTILATGARHVAFSPDGLTIAIAGWPWEEEKVRLCEAASGREKRALTGQKIGRIESLAYSPDGDTVATASADNTVTLWDATSGAANRTLRGHTDQVHCVVYSPDGRTIASASSDGTVKTWDAASGQQKLTLTGHAGGIASVAFSPDGLTLASAGTTNHTGSKLSGDKDSSIKLWDAASGEEKLTLRGHTDGVECVVYSPDGLTLASASLDDTVKLWDAASGQQKLTLTGHASGVFSVAFSPDGGTVASAGIDNTVRLWDANSGQEKLTISGHEKYVACVVFSPDGRTIASASSDGTVKLWNAAGGQN